MYKEYLAPVIKVTCKHFLNLDETFFLSVRLVAAAAISILALLLMQTLTLLQDGWHTVKTDARNIKEAIVDYRHQIRMGATKALFTEGFRSLRNGHTA